MERPGFEPPLCAMSTNRSLYAIYSQIPLDKCAFLHRRMTSIKVWLRMASSKAGSEWQTLGWLGMADIRLAQNDKH